MVTNRDGKVWVIEGGVDPAADLHEAEEQERPAALEPAPLVPQTRARKVNTREPSARALRRIVLAYALGPFLPGGRHPLWTPLALLGIALPLVLLLSGLLDASELARGRPLGVALHAVAAAALLAGFASWSRALLGAAGVRRADLPGALRRPGIAAFIGLWLPGFALLLAGRSRRAALALWNVAPLACALWLLFAPRGAEGWTLWLGFERVLIGAFIVLVISSLAWLAWALEGLRLQLSGQRSRGGLRGDRLVLWLLASLALFFFTFQPVTTAEDLHREAGALAGQGYRLLPLLYERAALGLDDSRPDYWLRTADYCERLGRSEEAAQLRGALWLHWRELGATLATQPSVVVMQPSPRPPSAKSAPTL